MDRNDLWKLLCEREKQVEAARAKRAITTILAFAVVYFLIFYFINTPTEFLDIVGELLAAIFIAGVHFWSNAIIFSTLCKKTTKKIKCWNT